MLLKSVRVSWVWQMGCRLAVVDERGMPGSDLCTCLKTKRLLVDIHGRVSRIGLSESPAEEATKPEARAASLIENGRRARLDITSSSKTPLTFQHRAAIDLRAHPSAVNVFVRVRPFVRAESGVLFASRYASQVDVVKRKCGRPDISKYDASQARIEPGGTAAQVDIYVWCGR